VRIVCPFIAGGSQDNIARRLGAKLGEYLGHSFVIDNRSGAGGAIAADNVAKSAPDGYSVLLGGIASHALVPNLLCCHPAFPHDTLAKLIAAARAEPGKFQYGGSGVGTSPTLAMELFKQKTGVELTLVSYRGAAASAADVLAGHIPLCIANIDSLMGQVSAGRLKPIASTGVQRSPVAPDTPTFVEAGFADLVVTSWTIWAVPAGTPAKANDKLRAATERALKDGDVVDSMRQGGFEPGFLALSEVDAFIKAEHKRWGEVIRVAGIKPQ
jgi:tripartite-type tricarboxylate transporter receptor subunit TctC